MRQATATENLAERSRLISEAVRWHTRALQASGLEAGPDDWAVAPDADPPEPEAS